MSSTSAEIVCESFTFKIGCRVVGVAARFDVLWLDTMVGSIRCLDTLGAVVVLIESIRFPESFLPGSSPPTKQLFFPPTCSETCLSRSWRKSSVSLWGSSHPNVFSNISFQSDKLLTKLKSSSLSELYLETSLEGVVGRRRQPCLLFPFDCFVRIVLISNVWPPLISSFLVLLLASSFRHSDKLPIDEDEDRRLMSSHWSLLAETLRFRRVNFCCCLLLLFFLRPCLLS
mmetsp:Transcript_20275/g.28986  ORF Transcript_20275/g.28986 Transcript_20275/m.28986 type:complete len:229 (-) Transcript_20275:518-1204(-)